MKNHLTPKTSTIIFRRLATPDEFLAAYKLRYTVYQQYWYRCLLHENENELDVDVFDNHSIHFGLFKKEDLIGYVRLVIAKEQVNEVDISSPYLPDHLVFDDSSDELYALPALAAHAKNIEFMDYFQSILPLGRVLEASRLVIGQEYRNNTFANFLIHSALVVIDVLCMNGGTVLINCLENHLPYYLRMGFEKVVQGEINTNPVYLLSLKLPFNRALSSIPSCLHQNFTKFMEEYLTNGQIHFHLDS